MRLKENNNEMEIKDIFLKRLIDISKNELKKMEKIVEIIEDREKKI